jgi:predicted glycogen debranching enzyme
MIKFDSEICTNFEKALSREWLETNGIGGFASATVAGANSRRYHGLLTAATRPPLGRIVTLSKFEETIAVNGKAYDLSANQYPNAVYPQGFKYLKSFRLDPFPVWAFEIEGIEIEKKIFMVYGANTTVCQWTLDAESRSADSGVTLELRPLLAFRDYHHLRHSADDFETDFVEESVTRVRVASAAEYPALFLTHVGAAVEKTGHWYRDFEHAIEKERGFEFRENLFQPLALKFDLKKTGGRRRFDRSRRDLQNRTARSGGDRAARGIDRTRRSERRFRAPARAGG